MTDQETDEREAFVLFDGFGSVAAIGESAESAHKALFDTLIDVEDAWKRLVKHQGWTCKRIIYRLAPEE